MMMGTGPLEVQMFAAIEREDLNDNLKVLTYADPLPLYHAADALLHPSEREGFSLVCAEAMCAGISGSPNPNRWPRPEMILENQTGQTTPINLNAFASAALKFLALGHQRLDEMGRAAAAHVRENFTFDRQYRQTLSLYRKLANRNLAN